MLELVLVLVLVLVLLLLLLLLFFFGVVVVVAGDGASAGGGSDVELHFTKTQHTVTVMDLNPNYKWISDEQNAGKTEFLCLTDKLFSPDLRRERHILQQQFKEKQHFQW